MKQIRTIIQPNAKRFDEEVNAALVTGWTLVRRYVYHTEHAFVAELEREFITEAERCCETCMHYDKAPTEEPCFSCSETASEWEPVQ